jgi:threonine-phosphate decarboxylase
VIDESYLPFISSNKSETMINSNFKNIIVLSSMSKIFSIPGLRTGFLKAPVKITEKFRKYQLPWNVNSLAQAAAMYILQQQKEMDKFIDASRQFIKTERDRFLARLKGIPGFSFFTGQVPFILIKLSGGLTADTISGDLSKDNILIRNCKNFKGLTDNYIRISLKDKHANQQLTEKLLNLVAQK